MTATAKLFKNGQSQAVRLPKYFRFDNEEEVFIKKIGDLVILFPKNQNRWKSMIESLDEFSDDFIIKREVLKLDKREELF